MRSGIHNIEKQTEKSHHELALGELKQGLENLQSRIDKLAETLGYWDETRQQLSDPTYYLYWRNRRVNNVKFIPDFVRAVELYTKNGDALRPNSEKLLPEKIPNSSRYLTADERSTTLFEFAPIFSSLQDKTVIGYVGLRISFIDALKSSYQFSHLDQATLLVPPGVYPFTVNDIFANLGFTERHSSELEELKSLMYETYFIIVLLIISMMAALLYIMSRLFSTPLVMLDKQIKRMHESDDELQISHDFSVREFNNLGQQLTAYHNNWIQAQQELNELNGQLEQKVKERTIELESVIHELESFSYSVSHDLRSPLRAINGYHFLLRDEYADKLDNKAHHYIDKTRDAINRMAQLIDDLLDLSKVSRCETVFIKLNLSQLVHDSINKLNEQDPQRQIDINIMPDIIVYGDASLLMILFDNLFSNAWKYTAQASNSIIEFGRNSDENNEAFYVRDNGVGFDMAYSDKLFRPFQRLHGLEYEGTGIGLAICARVIKRHGGKIWAQSSPHQGTTIYFTLRGI